MHHETAEEYETRHAICFQAQKLERRMMSRLAIEIIPMAESTLQFRRLTHEYREYDGCDESQ